MIASLCVFYDWRHHGDCRILSRIWIVVARSSLWTINSDLVGIYDKFQVEYVLVIYCLHKKKNNQKCLISDLSMLTLDNLLTRSSSLFHSFISCRVPYHVDVCCYLTIQTKLLSGGSVLLVFFSFIFFRYVRYVSLWRPRALFPSA